MSRSIQQPFCLYLYLISYLFYLLRKLSIYLLIPLSTGTSPLANRCLSTYLSIYLPTYLLFFLLDYHSVSTYLSIDLPTCLSLSNISMSYSLPYPSIDLLPALTFYPLTSIYLSVDLSISQPIHPLIYRSHQFVNRLINLPLSLKQKRHVHCIKHSQSLQHKITCTQEKTNQYIPFFRN